MSICQVLCVCNVAIVELKIIAQNERYVSGILDNEE